MTAPLKNLKGKMGTRKDNSEIKDLKQAVSLLHVAGSRLKLEMRGNEYWACCPFHEEKTPSFAIKKKDGEEVFFCQGCSAGGDVIKFIERTESLTTGQAIQKLRELSGNVTWLENAKKVTETFKSVTTNKVKQVFSADKFQRFTDALLSNQAAMDWLLTERGITAETARDLRLGYSQDCKGHIDEEHEHARDKGWILFPRFAADKLVAVKMRGLGAKAFSQWTGMDPKALFNADEINALEPVFVTEGEFDTAIFKQAGFIAVSIPNASTKLTPEMKIILKRAACIYLAGDNDGSVGNTAMRQLARELGAATFMILWPGAKDANQYFKENCAGNIEKFKADVTGLMNRARNTPIEGFTSLLERLRTTGGTNAAADPNRLHFSLKELDDMNYNPPGSVVVFYSTYSGTGKTIFTTQVMLDEAKRGQTVVVYSPELRDENYLALVAAQIVGPTRPNGLDRAGEITIKDYEETAGILDTGAGGGDFNYYVGHSLPCSDTDEVMEFIEQTIQVTGATRFVIDTLHRIIMPGPRENMVAAEGRIVKKFEELGIKYGTIFILIGQSNKEAEAIKELRHDSEGILRGSRELLDVAYGVYLIHRKKKQVKEGQADPQDLLEMETSIILKKDRGKGPGSSICRMIYVPKISTFRKLDTTNTAAPSMTEQMPAAPVNSEDDPY